jgi:hypothetical protein
LLALLAADGKEERLGSATAGPDGNRSARRQAGREAALEAETPPELDPGELQRLWGRVPRRLRKLLMSGRAGKYASRSEVSAALACALAARNWTPTDIAALVWHSPLGERWRERGRGWRNLLADVGGAVAHISMSHLPLRKSKGKGVVGNATFAPPNIFRQAHTFCRERLATHGRAEATGNYLRFFRPPCRGFRCPVCSPSAKQRRFEHVSACMAGHVRLHVGLVPASEYEATKRRLQHHLASPLAAFQVSYAAWKRQVRKAGRAKTKVLLKTRLPLVTAITWAWREVRRELPAMPPRPGWWKADYWLCASYPDDKQVLIISSVPDKVRSRGRLIPVGPEAAASLVHIALEHVWDKSGLSESHSWALPGRLKTKWRRIGPPLPVEAEGRVVKQLKLRGAEPVVEHPPGIDLGPGPIWRWPGPALPWEAFKLQVEVILDGVAAELAVEEEARRRRRRRAAAADD